MNDVSRIATEAGDFLTLWIANFSLGPVASQNYQFDEAIVHIKTALELTVLSKNLVGISSTKSSLSTIYSHKGNADLAFQISSEALKTAKESGDILALQCAYTAHGYSCYLSGYLKEAEKYLLEAILFYDKASNAAWGFMANAGLAWSYEGVGRYHEAKEYQKKCISILEERKFFPSWLNVHKLHISLSEIVNHEKDIDLHELDKLIASHENTRLAICESYGTQCIAKIYLNLDDQYMSESERWIKRGIDFNTKHDTKWQLARDHVIYANWFKKNVDILKTKEQLTIAIDLFKECGADGWVEKYKKELSSL